MGKTLTVFTPTFNRKHTLPELYKSLIGQTNKDFIWLIVDDGSSDGTDKLIGQWTNENLIEIRYYKQENGGKMRAHNYGANLCDTPFFVCIDSDDFLVSDAVEKISEKVSGISHSEKIAGVIAYRGHTPDKPIGNEFPDDLEEATLSGLYNMGFKGDTTLVFKTEVVKKFPFPVLNGEKFITEAYTYNQIDLEYKYFLLPQVLTICEYLDDGYTKNTMKLIFDNPGGWALYSCQNGNIASSFLKKVRHYAMAQSYKMMKKGHKVTLVPNKRVAFLIAYPIGCALYLRRMIKYSGGKNCDRNSRKK